MRTATTTRLLLLPLLAAALLACGDDTPAASPQASTSAPMPSATASPSTVTVSDAWVRAADGGMTGAFGVISNDGPDDLTLVSASSPAAAAVELHEVVTVDGQAVMQPKAGGFLVPGVGGHVLEPGADHIMLMGLTSPLLPGDDVEISLTFDDGTTLTYTAQVRSAEVGDETYSPTPSP